MKKLLLMLACAFACWAWPSHLQADTGTTGKKLGASLIWQTLITNASQFSANSTSPADGSSFANLIDNNKETVFHSVWEASMASSATTEDSWLQTLSTISGGINSDPGYHNLQVALNEPVSSFKFEYYGRNSEWHDNPNHIVIYATNNASLAASTISAESEQWTKIIELTPENANFPGDVFVIDQPYESPLIELGDSYKYIRFEIKGTTHQNKVDSRMFAVPDITGITWNVSEFQMYSPIEVESSMFIDNEILFVKDAASLTIGNLASGEAGDLIDGNTTASITTKAGESMVSHISAFRPYGFSQSVAITWVEGSADDKITKAGVYVSNDGINWTLQGSYTPEDNGNGVPVSRFIVADLGTKYKYIRLVPEATESNPEPVGSLALNIAEFNVSPATEILDMPLQALVDSYALGVEDYEYGKDPGFVGDYEVYEELFNAYTNALMALSNGSATEEQQLEMSKRLQQAKARAEARIIIPEAGKYYYIQSANKVFSDNEKVVDWFAPRKGNQPGWHVKQKGIDEAWTIEVQPSGYYAIKNAATGTYINHTEGIDANNSPLIMSNSLETDQELININYTGQFNIRASVATRYYNSQEAGTGEANDGPIASWTDKSLSSEGAWYILEVPAEELTAMLANANHNRLAALANSFVDNYEVGTDPGQYGKDVYEAAITEVAKAKAMLEDSNEYTEEQYAAAYDALKAAIEALENGKNEVETGYYVITDKKWAEISSSGNNTAAWTTVSESDFLQTAPLEIGNPAYIWKVTKLSGGNFTIQNIVDERFVDNTSLMQEGASIAVATSSNVEQTINWYSGRFEISNTAAANFLYHSGRNTTKRENVYIVNNGSHVTWSLHRYTDAEADSIIKAYPQRLLTEELEGLIKEAMNKANNTTEYELDLESPIVTDASQFYCNNMSTEGSYENLIDNNFDTHFISAYNASAITSENAYHYLRVDAGEGNTLPEKFGMHWRTRGSVWNNLYRPVDVIYSVSDDAQNWIDLGEDANPAAGFPVTAEEPEFTSKTAIAPGRGYRYFKLTVLKTNTQDMGLNGYPFFTFSEFNLYPVKRVLESSPINDPEVKTAVEAVEAAIATAQQKINANSVTSQDITDFRNVYNELLLVYKDTSDLYNVYTQAAEYYVGVSIGDEYEPFTFPEDKVIAFEDAFFAVEDARPFTEISQRQVAALDSALTKAFNELKASMHNIDTDKWYNILSADETSTAPDGSPISGQCAYIGGLSSVDGTGLTGATLEDLGTRATWKFIPTETAGQYYIANCWSGWRMDSGNLFELVPIGDGQVALKRVYDNGYYYVNQGVLPGVPILNNVSLTVNGPAAWTIEEAPEVLLDKYTCYQGEITSAALPYESYRPYVREDFTTLSAYKVSGYQTSADGKEVTAINLTEYADDENIPAATPFIFTVPYPEDVFDANTLVKVSMEPIVHSEVTQEMKPANGLIGTFSQLALAEGMIQFDSGDSAFVKSEGYTIVERCVYLDVNKIVNNPDAKVDKVVYVAGRAGLVNGIKDVMLDANKPMNVYTTDGVLIRRNVMPAEATKGLARGIYIVGKDKVMVR